MRGIDNEAYYRLVDEDPQYYMDYTGTGNSLNVRNPHTLQLIMDSLRYWVTEMHVDGFRFDLAATLAREFYDVDRLSAFFDLVQQDPVVSQVKLIAEPWDVGPGGYQVGNFPPLWTEWNGKYRDTVRDFWRGEPATLGEFASRITGSSDLYQDDGRRPFASINFVTAHDGFTLRRPGVLQRQAQRGQRRGRPRRRRRQPVVELRRRGRRPTTRRSCALRGRQRRNFIATLLLSQGVPMLLHGDELGRTQQGNNNAYCQDNELSWVDWSLAKEQRRPACEFTGGLTALRHRAPGVPAPPVLPGPADRARATSCGDIAWFTPAGEEMTEQTGTTASAGRSASSSTARPSPSWTARGERSTDDSFLLCFNAARGHRRSRSRATTTAATGRSWWTPDRRGRHEAPGTVAGGATLTVPARSLVVLQREQPR